MIPLRLPIWVEGLCATWVGAIRQLSNCSSVAVTASVFCTAAWDVSGDDGWHIEGYCGGFASVGPAKSWLPFAGLIDQQLPSAVLSRWSPVFCPSRALEFVVLCTSCIKVFQHQYLIARFGHHARLWYWHELV